MAASTQVDGEPMSQEIVPDAALAAALSTTGQHVEVLQRHHYEGGTVPKEIVLVRSPTGTRWVFCKHGAAAAPAERSRRRGTAYEGEMYRRLWDAGAIREPALVGTFVWGETATLVLEHLAGAVRLSEAPREMIRTAASWIGAFHHTCAHAIPYDLEPFVHDGPQLRTWARRARAFSEGLHDRYPWVPEVCDLVDAAADDVLAGPPCLLHGEFTVHNVLLWDGRIVPVDWEGASVGVGEIDLAMLVERWPADAVTACVRDYRAARYGDTRSREQHYDLAAARLYVTLRWLGDSAGLAMRERTRWRYDDLRDHARALGLL